MHNVNDKEIYNIFHNKNIALIGNSVALQNFNLGADIDDNDIICRINKGPILNDKQKYGTRTDVLFYSDPKIITDDVLSVLDNNTKFIVSPTRHKNNIFPNRYTYIIDNKFYNKIITTTGYKNLGSQWPSNGLVASFLILEQNPKKLTLFGFDWNKHKTFYQHRHKNEPRHDWNLESQYLMSQQKVKIVNMTAE